MSGGKSWIAGVGDTPYGRLDEGFRMMAHGGPGLAIGTRVRASFRSHGERALPYFKRDGEGSP